jgi:hypothetical protein
MRNLQTVKPAQKKIEKGQSLMELAVSMILLLILLAGIFDLGRAAIAYFILQESAEEGIVYGIAFPTDCNQITMRIRKDIEHTIVTSPVNVSIMIENNAGGYTACYTIPYAQVYASKKMTITVTTDFPITMPFLGTILGRQYIPLNVSTNGVILRPPEEAVNP